MSLAPVCHSLAHEGTALIFFVCAGRCPLHRVSTFFSLWPLSAASCVPACAFLRFMPLSAGYRATEIASLSFPFWTVTSKRYHRDLLCQLHCRRMDAKPFLPSVGICLGRSGRWKRSDLHVRSFTQSSHLHRSAPQRHQIDDQYVAARTSTRCRS